MKSKIIDTMKRVQQCETMIPVQQCEHLLMIAWIYCWFVILILVVLVVLIVSSKKNEFELTLIVNIWIFLKVLLSLNHYQSFEIYFVNLFDFRWII